MIFVSIFQHITRHKVGDDDVATKASSLASKIYYANGYGNYKAKKMDEAVKELDNSISENEMNFKSHLLKIVILKEMGNEVIS